MIIVNFTIELVYIILNTKIYLESKYRLIYFILLCIFICFTRNNGVYILFFVIITLVIYFRKRMSLFNQIKILLPLFIGIFLFSFCIHFLYPLLDIDNNSKQESSSIFCQQIGRYLKYYSSNLTENEKRMLFMTFVDWENIEKEYYNPVLSDHIKERLLYKNNSNKLKDLWLTFFIKRPLVYFEAFFYHTASYYSLTYEKIPFEWHGIGMELIIDKRKSLNPDNYLNIFFTLDIANQREAYKTLHYFIKHIPGISLLYNAPLYTYIMVLCFIAIILYRQKKKLIIFIPSIVTFLVALASPVNGSLRYFLPILAITPILIGITLMKENKDENSDNLTGV